MRGFQLAGIVVFILGVVLQGKAQQANVRSDKYRILIGEQANLTLNATLNKGQHLVWPEFPDSLGPHFDVVSRSTPDTLTDSTSASLQIRQQVVITSFDSGMYTLPVFAFDFINPGGDTVFIVSDPLSIEVLTVAVDTTQAIKDIHDVADVPFDIREYLPWILGGLAGAALLAAGIYLWLRRRRPEKPAPPPAPVLPPWEKALEALSRIENEKIWRTGYIKEYHSAISDTIRTYIEEYFHLPALESTTEEIMQMLRKKDLPGQAVMHMNELLVLADLVKFAKEKPLPAEHERSLELAKEFVAATRPQEPEKEPGGDRKEGEDG